MRQFDNKKSVKVFISYSLVKSNYFIYIFYVITFKDIEMIHKHTYFFCSLVFSFICRSVDALSAAAKWPLPLSVSSFVPFRCAFFFFFFFIFRLFLLQRPVVLYVDVGYKRGRQRRTSPACISLWGSLSVGAPDWGLERRRVSKLAHPSQCV